jgi:hypothetical protein
MCSCSVLNPRKHSTIISAFYDLTLHNIESPTSKHFPTVLFAGTVYLFPGSSSSYFSSSILFLAFNSSICRSTFCSFSCSILPFSVLHLSQFQLSLCQLLEPLRFHMYNDTFVHIVHIGFLTVDSVAPTTYVA